MGTQNSHIVPFLKSVSLKKKKKVMTINNDKHLSWKTCFLLVVALARRVSELHGPSCSVQLSRG